MRGKTTLSPVPESILTRVAKHSRMAEAVVHDYRRLLRDAELVAVGLRRLLKENAILRAKLEKRKGS